MAGNANFDAILSTTLNAYRKKLEDNIFRANPLFAWLYGKGKKETQTGGNKIVVPLLYGKNTTAGAYSKYDLLDTTPQEGITAAEFDWKQYAASISIARKEERQNAPSETRVLNLLQSKIMQAEESLRELLDEHSFLSNASASNNLTGLALAVDSAGTYGNIARGSNSWWSANETGSGSFASQGLNDMRTMYNDCSKGNIHPDLILTTQTVFEYYEKTLQPQERFTDTKTLDGGFQNLKFKGATMMFDLYCQSGVMYFLNSNFMKLIVESGTDLITTPFVKPENQDAKVAQILWMGDMVCSNCDRQGKLTGITA